MTALVLCSLVFGVGLYVVLTRREIIAILAGVELMLGSANILLVALASFAGADGGVIGSVALAVLVVAAAEAAVGLALVVSLARRSKRSRVEELLEVKG
ncbi:MAG: NADH-quinone oxidoreductase subunit NuoK [Actinobacteria bacterium HGW-Actinobacteria-6]|jgi:NADH-quinone oxidoreductase subunit K|nr:MAG: NADH-quinone oxidoreductase subunit NuoK [Actinobacteria bacterium HGW-Actinobacteria-6]